MNKKELAQIAAAKLALRTQWEKACDFEQIPHDSTFIIFSVSNTETDKYNKMALELDKMRQRIVRNVTRRERHEAMTSLGLKRVKGALGGTYYE
jgi:hypothetical protein